MDYLSHLSFYKDFPVPGINFVDIIPLMQDKALFRQITADLGALCAAPTVATPEARGFLFAAPLLTGCEHIASVIPLRKKGKLPYREGDLVGVEITKEYGTDHLYYRLSDVAAGRRDGNVFHVTFFDDILATGGTALGAARSLEAQTLVVDGEPCRVKVDDFVFLVELDELKGREVLEQMAPVKSLIHV